jgi:hypothetical protein
MTLGRASVILFLGCASSLACGHRAVPATQLPRWVFDAGRSAHPHPREGIRGRSESSDFVVAALQGAGLRFGTDGTVRSLWQYLRTSHPAVPPTAAKPGDVLLFRVAPPGSAEGNACDVPDGAGIVSEVDGSGRIGFVEARNGRTLLSYVDPLHPRTRRDDGGQVRNSFLRAARAGDPLESPLLAGEMLCAVARPFS